MSVRIVATRSASWLCAEAFSPRALAQILQKRRRELTVNQKNTVTILTINPASHGFRAR